MPKEITHRGPSERLEASLMQRCGVAIERGRLTLASDTTTPDLSTARSLLRDALAPAPERTVVALLATLSTLVARRTTSDDDADVALAAYTVRLLEYPADLVTRALNDWPARSQWWPTWFELRNLLEPATALRREWLADLDRIEALLTRPRIEADPLEDARRRQAAEAEAAHEHAEVAAGLRSLGQHLRVVASAEAAKYPSSKTAGVDEIRERVAKRGQDSKTTKPL